MIVHFLILSYHGWVSSSLFLEDFYQVFYEFLISSMLPHTPSFPSQLSVYPRIELQIEPCFTSNRTRDLWRLRTQTLSRPESITAIPQFVSLYLA
jgi:hypothetical protein